MKSIYLLLTILVLGINDEIFSQSNATILIDSTICVHIDSLKKIKLNKRIIKIARKAVLKHGAEYYKEYKKPIIKYQKVGKHSVDLAVSEVLKYNGRIYYTIEYPYDDNKELFYSSYSAKVYLWEDLSIFLIVFGNGRYLDYETLSRQEKRKIKVPYQSSLPLENVLDTIRDEKGNIIKLRHTIKERK